MPSRRPASAAAVSQACLAASAAPKAVRWASCARAQASGLIEPHAALSLGLFGGVEILLGYGLDRGSREGRLQFRGLLVELVSPCIGLDNPIPGRRYGFEHALRLIKFATSPLQSCLELGHRGAQLVPAVGDRVQVLDARPIDGPRLGSLHTEFGYPCPSAGRPGLGTFPFFHSRPKLNQEGLRLLVLCPSFFDLSTFRRDSSAQGASLPRPGAPSRPWRLWRRHWHPCAACRLSLSLVRSLPGRGRCNRMNPGAAGTNRRRNSRVTVTMNAASTANRRSFPFLSRRSFGSRLDVPSRSRRNVWGDCALIPSRVTVTVVPLAVIARRTDIVVEVHKDLRLVCAPAYSVRGPHLGPVGPPERLSEPWTSPPHSDRVQQRRMAASTSPAPEHHGSS